MPELWNSFPDGPLSVISIDDGLVGNLELKEVFQKHRVKPILYLCTGIICRESGFWWLSVRSQQQVEKLKLLYNEEREQFLYNLGFEKTRKVTPRQAIPKECLGSVLDWADLGAHTRFHPILTRCKDQECSEEISLSKNELLPFGISLNDFAYPNGFDSDYSDREVRFIKDAGFRSARTCEPGWNSFKSDRFRLKAIVIDDNASVDKFAVQLTGIPALTKSCVAKVLGMLRRLAGT